MEAEKVSLTAHLYDMPEHGGVPKAFINATSAFHYDLEEDGLEIIEAPIKQTSSKVAATTVSYTL